ncbi:unnamed protein product [Amoebophrya sp. A120]|nr:unnamed protein product [Amoebophrya sp. A120]|eukprot:GSA120T00020726001.1
MSRRSSAVTMKPPSMSRHTTGSKVLATFCVALCHLESSIVQPVDATAANSPTENVPTVPTAQHAASHYVFEKKIAIVSLEMAESARAKPAATARNGQDINAARLVRPTFATLGLFRNRTSSSTGAPSSSKWPSSATVSQQNHGIMTKDGTTSSEIIPSIKVFGSTTTTAKREAIRVVNFSAELKNCEKLLLMQDNVGKDQDDSKVALPSEQAISASVSTKVLDQCEKDLEAALREDGDHDAPQDETSSSSTVTSTAGKRTPKSSKILIFTNCTADVFPRKEDHLKSSEVFKKGAGGDGTKHITSDNKHQRDLLYELVTKSTFGAGAGRAGLGKTSSSTSPDNSNKGEKVASSENLEVVLFIGQKTTKKYFDSTSTQVEPHAGASGKQVEQASSSSSASSVHRAAPVGHLEQLTVHPFYGLKNLLRLIEESSRATSGTAASMIMSPSKPQPAPGQETSEVDVESSRTTEQAGAVEKTTSEEETQTLSTIWYNDNPLSFSSERAKTLLDPTFVFLALWATFVVYCGAWVACERGVYRNVLGPGLEEVLNDERSCWGKWKRRNASREGGPDDDFTRNNRSLYNKHGRNSREDQEHFFLTDDEADIDSDASDELAAEETVTFSFNVAIFFFLTASLLLTMLFFVIKYIRTGIVLFYCVGVLQASHSLLRRKTKILLWKIAKEVDKFNKWRKNFVKKFFNNYQNQQKSFLIQPTPSASAFDNFDETPIDEPSFDENAVGVSVGAEQIMMTPNDDSPDDSIALMRKKQNLQLFKEQQSPKPSTLSQISSHFRGENSPLKNCSTPLNKNSPLKNSKPGTPVGLGGQHLLMLKNNNSSRNKNRGAAPATPSSASARTRTGTRRRSCGSASLNITPLWRRENQSLPKAAFYFIVGKRIPFFSTRQCFDFCCLDLLALVPGLVVCLSYLVTSGEWETIFGSKHQAEPGTSSTSSSNNIGFPSASTTAMLKTPSSILLEALSQNLMGFFVCVHLQKIARIPSLKLGVQFLTIMFFFDIFWVFGSSSLFNGKSVMLEVATGGNSDGEDTTAKPLPMLMHMPNLLSVCFALFWNGNRFAVAEEEIPMILRNNPGFHEQLQTDAKLVFGENFDLTEYVVSQTTQSSSLHRGHMLGLGDIALPGFLLSFCLAVDLKARILAKEKRAFELHSTTQDGGLGLKMTAALADRRNGTTSDELVQLHLQQHQQEPELKVLENNKSPNLFFPTLFCYFLGLCCANFAVAFFEFGQPALLYLVPAVVGASVYQLWNKVGGGERQRRGQGQVLQAVMQDTERQDQELSFKSVWEGSLLQPEEEEDEEEIDAEVETKEQNSISVDDDSQTHSREYSQEGDQGGQQFRSYAATPGGTSTTTRVIGNTIKGSPPPTPSARSPKRKNKSIKKRKNAAYPQQKQQNYLRISPEKVNDGFLKEEFQSQVDLYPAAAEENELHALPQSRLKDEQPAVCL